MPRFTLYLWNPSAVPDDIINHTKKMERVKIRMLSDLDQGVSIVYPSLLLGGPEFLKMTERRVSDFYLRIEGGQVGGMLQVWGEEALQHRKFFNFSIRCLKTSNRFYTKLPFTIFCCMVILEVC